MSQIVNLNLNQKHSVLTLVELFANISLDEDLEINIQHTRGRIISVEVYPILCSIYAECRALNSNVKVNFELPENCSQLSYAERMNFLDYLDIRYKTGKKRNNPNGRFIELRNLKVGSYGIPELEQVFRTNFSIDSNTAMDVAFVINELLCNMTMHSKSKSGGFFYCQKYNSSEILNIYIVDSGQGIANSMKSNSEYVGMSNSDLLSLSLEWEKGSGNGRGHGLYFISQFIERNNFNLSILSGTNFIQIKEGKRRIHNNANYNGVIIKIGIKFDIQVTMKDLWSEKSYTNV